MEGYTVWSRKGNIPHVEPPVALLQNMVTLRIHLDPCGCNNGPLQLLPGSHTLGRLRQADIVAQSQNKTPYICLAMPGDILAMRALTIHRSETASTPSRRRVLHLEFSTEQLPQPLEWAIA